MLTSSGKYVSSRANALVATSTNLWLCSSGFTCANTEVRVLPCESPGWHSTIAQVFATASVIVSAIPVTGGLPIVLRVKHITVGSHWTITYLLKGNLLVSVLFNLNANVL